MRVYITLKGAEFVGAHIAAQPSLNKGYQTFLKPSTLPGCPQEMHSRSARGWCGWTAQSCTAPLWQLIPENKGYTQILL